MNKDFGRSNVCANKKCNMEGRGGGFIPVLRPVLDHRFCVVCLSLFVDRATTTGYEDTEPMKDKDAVWRENEDIKNDMEKVNDNLSKSLSLLKKWI